MTGNDSQPLVPHQRVDAATVYQGFQEAVNEAGGTEQTYQDAVAAETRELFDCNIRDLYRGTGAQRGNRSTLPVEAQEAYMANEVIAKHELAASSDSYSDNPAERHGQIVEQVKATSKRTRKFLPW